MFDCGASVRTALETLVRSFDRGSLSGEEAVAVVRNLGVVRKLADALAGQAALRVEETGVRRRFGDRTAAATVVSVRAEVEDPAARAARGGASAS